MFFLFQGCYANETNDTKVRKLNTADYKIAVDDIRNSCGINSAYFILYFLNKTPDYLNLKKELATTDNSKVSIADLERVLSEVHYYESFWAKQRKKMR